MTGLKYEKNKARKDTILKRVDGYFKRAEELKKYIDEQKSGGGSSKSDGGEKGDTATKDRKDEKDGDDEETSKLRGALSSAIVSEKVREEA